MRNLLENLRNTNYVWNGYYFTLEVFGESNEDESLLIKSQVLFPKIQMRKWRHNQKTVLKGSHA